MRVAAPPSPEAASTVGPLRAALPSVLPSVARAARIGFDRRFAAWVASLWPVAASVGPARPRTERLSLDLVCAHGGADIAVDPEQWPALQMAADLGDAALARSVVEALLSPLLQTAARALPGAQLRSVRRYAAEAVAITAPTLAMSEGAVSLVRVDTALAEHLEAQLRSAVPADLRPFERLSLPARLQWFERPFSCARLRTLATGDIVLFGASRRAGERWRAKLLFGLGITMQADAEIDLDSSRAHVAARPHVAEEGASLTGAAPGIDVADLADVQVPVSFEVDSARVALGELAALGPGAVIELATPLAEATVRLVCQGQTVGVGQLVAVGDQLGVRIERMGLERAARAGGVGSAP